MTPEHKAAMERGRAEGRAVRDYLEGVRHSKPKRGRKRTAESIGNRLEKIEAELPDASAIDDEHRSGRTRLRRGAVDKSPAHRTSLWTAPSGSVTCPPLDDEKGTPKNQKSKPHINDNYARPKPAKIIVVKRSG